jgi:predicted ribosomally synthesized peptide with SipW-like signal peptide
MALCGSLIAGSTYALFTDTAEVNIAVTSGKVDVVATVSDLATYSAVAEKNLPSNYSKSDEDKVEDGDKLGDYSGTYYYVTQSSGSFVNGGTASWNNTTSTLTLDKITPGDKVTFNISVTNYSNVATKYRIKLYYDSENSSADGVTLFRSLKISVPINEQSGDTTTTTSYLKDSDTNVQSMTTPWIDLNAVANNATSEDIIAKNTETANVTVELPITIGNEAQDKTCAIKYVVEAVQSNASVSSYFDAQIEYVTQTASVEKPDNLAENASLPVTVNNAITNQSYDETDTTSTQSKTVPVTVSLPSSTLSSASSVSVTVAEKSLDEINESLTSTTSTISLDAGSTVYAFDVTTKIDGNTADTLTTSGAYYVTSFTIEKYVSPTVYHKDEALIRYDSSATVTDSTVTNVQPTNEEYYTYNDSTGEVTVYTKSFSPFVVSYLYGGGLGTEKKPYLISSVFQLQGLALTVNLGTSYSGKYFKLTNDIDLDGINWTPIGKWENVFAGTFDGAKSESENYTISNLTINDDTMEDVGLFGVMDDGTIKNLNLVNVNTTGMAQVGTIIGEAFRGTVSNCTVSGTIKVQGYYKVGGIAGDGYAKFEKCKVIGNSDSYIQGVYLGAKDEIYKNVALKDDREGDCVGGIVGYTGEENSVCEMIKNCTVKNISIAGARKVGGQVGYLQQNVVVSNATVTDVNISTNADTDYLANNFEKIYVGGIVGDMAGGSYEHGTDAISGTISGGSILGLIANKTGLAVGGSRSNSNIQTSVQEDSDNKVSVDYLIKNAAKNNTISTVKCLYDYIEVDSARGLLLANKLYTIAVNNKTAENIFSAGINYGSGDTLATIKITENIDLSGYDWNSLYGVGLKIDGDNHTISNINCVQGVNGKAGFFSYFGSTQVVNLTLENVTVSGCQAGILAGQVEYSAYNLVDNLTIKGTNKVTWEQNTTSNYVEEWGGVGVVFGEMNSTSTNQTTGFVVTLDTSATVEIDRTGLPSSKCTVQSEKLIWGYSTSDVYTNVSTLQFTNNGTITINSANEQ